MAEKPVVAQIIDPTLETYTEHDLNELVLRALPRLSHEHKKGVATASVAPLHPKEKKELVKEMGIPDPAPGVSDKIWLVVTWTMAIVLVGSVITLAIGMFTNVVKAELLLAVFTGAIGFLTGLFAPSPLTKKEG